MAPLAVERCEHTPDPSLPFQPIEVDVELTVQSPGAGQPQSSINVGDGVDSCTVLQGGTSYMLTLTTRGPRTLTALYGGDGNFAASSATVIHHVNRLPTIVPATYSTGAGIPLKVPAVDGVLAHASDADGEALTIVNVGSGSTSGVGGTVILAADGGFTFTPANNTMGVAVFGASVSDGLETVNTTVAITITPRIDLAVSIDDERDFAQGGNTVDYTFVARNQGVSDAVGAHLTSPLPLNLVDSIWSCVADADATCSASGSGGIEDTINIPSGARVTYVQVVTVLALPEMPLTNAAHVTASAGVPDGNSTNDTASDVDVVGIFADGLDPD